jgi:hypothetical protein
MILYYDKTTENKDMFSLLLYTSKRNLDMNVLASLPSTSTINVNPSRPLAYSALNNDKLKLTREDVEDFVALLSPMIEELSIKELEEGNYLFWLVECLLFSLKNYLFEQIFSIASLLFLFFKKAPTRFFQVLLNRQKSILP